MPSLDSANLGQAGLDQTLGISYEVLDVDRVVALLPVTPKLHQPFGYLHGGTSLALAESVASVAGCLNAPEGMAAFGLEVNGNHLRPVRQGTLRAEATPLHRGRTTQVWDVKIHDERGHLICVARCTLALVKVQREGIER